MSEVIKFDFEIDPSDTALLVIDMQNGFVHPEGTFGKRSLNRNQLAIVPHIRGLVRVCREAGVPVIWSIQEHLKGDVTRRRHKIPSHIEKRNIFVALRGTWDAEVYDDLKGEVRPEDHLLYKHRASCFFDTNLATKLRMLGVQMLIVSGVNSNYCVESTIREGYFHDFDIVVPEDCIAGSFPDLHEATLKNVRIYFGAVTNLAEITQKLAARKGKALAAGGSS
ncbi:MAG: cysteine hydrolase [Candidatus Tectomicrobia bacterium]|nr:cysteine hydrolase [Candidatus Tectomicrobia bacterium]